MPSRICMDNRKASALPSQKDQSTARTNHNIPCQKNLKESLDKTSISDDLESI